MIRKLLFSLLLPICASSLFAEAKVLHVAADNWMPYNGDPGEARPGYVVEVLKAIYEPVGIKVDYQTMSYTEALTAVREKRLDAVIGPDEVEGEGMVLPKEPFCLPKIALIVPAKSTWTYESISSLNGQILGAVKGYTYWPILDSYVERNPKAVVFAEGDNPLAELIEGLDSGKIQVVVETEAAWFWYLRKHMINSKAYRTVLRQPSTPCYVAFAPSDEGKSHAAFFDEGLAKLRSSGELEKILKQYGLVDWK